MTKDLTTTSFRTEFNANPEIVSKALNQKIRHMTVFSSFIEERINIEQTFTRSLQKLLGRDFNFAEGSTLEEGFTKLKIDFGNEHGERTTYVENLATDILPQLHTFRDKYAKVVKTISEQLTSQGKKYRAQYKSWDKTKTRFHRSCAEASNAQNNLLQMATGNKTKKNTDVVKLGKRVNQTIRAQQEWEKKFANEDIKYRKLQNEIESTVDSALYKYQELEIERISCLKDILRKMLVYGVNFIRNRQYDINNIAEVMEKINAESDLLEIIEKLKKKKTKHSSIVPPAPAELDIPMINSVRPDSPITSIKPASVPQIIPVPPIVREVISAPNEPQTIEFKPVAVEKIETKLEPASIPLPSPTQVEEKIKKSDQKKTPIQHKLIIDPHRLNKSSTKEECTHLRARSSNENTTTPDPSHLILESDSPNPSSSKIESTVVSCKTIEDDISVEDDSSVITQGDENAI